MTQLIAHRFPLQNYFNFTIHPSRSFVLLSISRINLQRRKWKYFTISTAEWKRVDDVVVLSCQFAISSSAWRKTIIMSEVWKWDPQKHVRLFVWSLLEFWLKNPKRVSPGAASIISHHTRWLMRPLLSSRLLSLSINFFALFEIETMQSERCVEMAKKFLRLILKVNVECCKTPPKKKQTRLVVALLSPSDIPLLFSLFFVLHRAPRS